MTDQVSGPVAEPQGTATVMEPYGVGVDVHSRFIAVCVLVRQEHSGSAAVHEKQFGVTWPELGAALAWARETAGVVFGEPLRYCIESTGCYHMPVLLSWGGEPSVVNPLLAGPTRRKTDVLDAKLLAHHSITRMWRASFIPGEQGQVLRLLWAERNEHTRMRTRCMNRANNLLLRFGHTFGASVGLRVKEGRAMADSLAAGETPKGANVNPEGVPEGARDVLRSLLAEADHHRSLAAVALAKSESFVRGTAWRFAAGAEPGAVVLRALRSVPGVGAATSLVWLAEVVDWRRFSNAKQVAAYCGCDPSVKVSAGKVTSHVRRKGNAKLHFALVQAASRILARSTGRIAEWGRSIAGRHRKGGARKARGAVARRLAAGMWHVLRTGQDYNEELYPLIPPGDVPYVGVRMLPISRSAMTALEFMGNSRRVVAAAAAGELAPLGISPKDVEKILRWREENLGRRPAGAAKPAVESRPAQKFGAGGPKQQKQTDKRERKCGCQQKKERCRG